MRYALADFGTMGLRYEYRHIQPTPTRQSVCVHPRQYVLHRK
jgi:hypothetical protein